MLIDEAKKIFEGDVAAVSSEILQEAAKVILFALGKAEEKILDMEKNFIGFKNLKGEIWRDICGYEELYQVSNKGRVRSKHAGDWRLLKSRTGKKHYPTVTLCKNHVQKSYSVHSLVAKTFLPNLENLPVVDHLDTNRQNNDVENLEWVTYGENISRSWRNGHRDGNNSGIKNGRAKLTEEQVSYIRKNYKARDKKFGAVPSAKKFNVFPSTIENAALYKTYKDIQ